MGRKTRIWIACLAAAGVGGLGFFAGNARAADPPEEPRWAEIDHSLVHTAWSPEWALRNAEELGLTTDQIERIEAIYVDKLPEVRKRWREVFERQERYFRMLEDGVILPGTTYADTLYGVAPPYVRFSEDLVVPDEGVYVRSPGDEIDWPEGVQPREDVVAYEFVDPLQVGSIDVLQILDEEQRDRFRRGRSTARGVYRRVPFEVLGPWMDRLELSDRQRNQIMHVKAHRVAIIQRAEESGESIRLRIESSAFEDDPLLGMTEDELEAAYEQVAMKRMDTEAVYEAILGPRQRWKVRVLEWELEGAPERSFE